MKKLLFGLMFLSGCYKTIYTFDLGSGKSAYESNAQCWYKCKQHENDETSCKAETQANQYCVCDCITKHY